MVLKFNDLPLDSVQYNGSDLNFLKLNGETIWERYPAGTVVFIFDTPGTYEFFMPVQGYYRIQIVGGGSDGSSSAAGHAGGYISVTGHFRTYGNHTITVGDHGSTGGDTSFINGLATSNTIRAGGGTSSSSTLGPTNSTSAIYTIEANVASLQQASNYNGNTNGPGAGGLINSNGHTGIAIITKI